MACRTVGLLAFLAVGAAIRLQHADSPAQGEIADSPLEGVVRGVSDPAFQELWWAYQRRLAERVRADFPARSNASFRVLVVSPVKGTKEAADTFRENQLLLEANGHGDAFDYALFHYDEATEEWEKREWYGDRRIVVKRKEPLCKAMAWSYITNDMAAAYTHIWLLDGDLRMDMFSWELYRTVLAGMNPLVSQPSILPREPGMRSTDKYKLRMLGRKDGKFPVLREVHRTEVMAPLLSAKLWPMVRERLFHSDLSTVWYHNNLWDTAAYMARHTCGQPAVLLVNAAPLRHLNFHDLLDRQQAFRRFNCTTGCGEFQANCQPLTSREVALLTKGMADTCNVTGSEDFNCMEQIDTCRRRITSKVDAREWVVEAGGNLKAFKYKCTAPEDTKNFMRRDDNCELWE